MTGFLKKVTKAGGPGPYAMRTTHNAIQDRISPDMPAPTAPIAEPGDPTIDEARQAEEEANRLRRRRGLASTFLTRTFGRPGLNSASAALSGGGVPAGTGLDAPKPRRSGAPTYKQP
jgi:hypothetical protein